MAYSKSWYPTNIREAHNLEYLQLSNVLFVEVN